MRFAKWSHRRGKLGLISIVTAVAVGALVGVPSSPAAARTDNSHKIAAHGSSYPESAYGVGPGGFNFDPEAEAHACTGTVGNKKSDVGVTPTSITLGNVSALSGPYAEIPAAPDAVKALFQAINQYGGICGRKLELVVKDSGSNPTVTASDTRALASSVFAFVGGDDPNDGAEAPVLATVKVPAIESGINDALTSSRLYWSAAPLNGVPVVGTKHYIYDTLFLGLKALKLAPKKLALVSQSFPIGIESAEDFGKAFERVDGTSICYRLENLTSSTSAASYDAAALAMKQAGCDGVFSASEIAPFVELLKAMRVEHYNPPFIMDEEDGYDTAFSTLAGSVGKGMMVFLWTAPLNENTPMVSLYKSELKAIGDSSEVSTEGVIAWDDAQMFVYSLLKAGRNPTRGKVESTLRHLTDWTIGDLASPYDPADYAKPAGECIVVVRYTGEPNKGFAGFVRDWPSTGFYCNSASRILEVEK